MRLGDKVVLPVLLYLFRQIERRLSGDPTLIVLDEAWVFFGHPLFQSKIREWLKTFRKKNAAVILATQNPSDVFNSGIVNVLLESCPTRFLLANPGAKSPDSTDFYRRMGLNDREIDIIASASPKQHYYIIKPEGRRLVSLGLGPVALSFVGASGDVDRRTFRSLIRTHGRLEGALRWLESRGQADWAAYARSIWRPE
jgi:type IV secretion system protein VirB4